MIMRSSLARWLSVSVVLLAGAADAAAENSAAPEKIRFRDHVYPLLAARCFECHAGRDSSSGRRLDDRAELLGETNGAPLVQVGRSQRSLLIARITADEPDRRMPPEGGPLTATEIGLLRAWIDQGLDWDDSLFSPTADESDHWAFQPIVRPALPELRRTEWITGPVDAFIAAEHERRALAPAEPASRRVLIRRLSLDLRGFPPTPEEVQAFLDDATPTAYTALVERLLASPHYGERWGRHWLDVARWAESEGYESNHPRPFSWRYRDYVIRSFNADKPFDAFVREQLAGDEIVPYADENLIATGFLAAARLSSNEEDKWLQRNAMLVDVVNAVGSAFLGLTINCAQCHNHKFDPITARDYYRLQGFFLSGQPVNARLQDPDLVRESESLRPEEYEPAQALKQAIFESARARLVAKVKQGLNSKELEAIETPADRRTPEQELLTRKVDLLFQNTPGGIEQYIPEADRTLYQELKKKIAEIEKACPPIPQTFAFYSPVSSPHALEILPDQGFYPLPYDPEELARRRPYLQIRGDVHQIGPTLSTGWPAVLNKSLDSPSRGTKELTRLDLAAWLTDPKHPLTARVWVNRIWHYHFGRGLVATPGDFGLQGTAPSHAKLLDWLAAELIDSGWSTKHIHRLILNSNTYRQSTQASRPEFHEIDPENEFLWHCHPRRLEAEALRDSLLAVAGELDAAIGGASVPSQDFGTTRRRSLYLFQKRGAPPEMQSLFDGPREAAESCPRRHSSTTALQSLYLLNDEFAQEQAAALAKRVVEQAGADRDQQIEAAFSRVLGRPPDNEERAAARSFFETHPSNDEASAIVHFCQALLNVNEFAYLE
jgi:hypothetical protein